MSDELIDNTRILNGPFINVFIELCNVSNVIVYTFTTAVII